MDVLRAAGSPLRPGDLDRSRRFYRDILGLAVYGSPAHRTIPGWSSFPAGAVRGVQACGRAAWACGHALDSGTGRPRRACPAGRNGVRVTQKPDVEL